MARRWQRIGGLTASVILLFFVFTTYRRVREDAVRPGLEPPKEPPAKPKMLYLPQDERPGEHDAIFGDVALGTQTSSAASLESIAVAVPPKGPAATPSQDPSLDHHGVVGEGQLPSGSGAQLLDIDRVVADIAREHAQPSASPPKPDLSKAIVMGRLSSEETSWVASQLPDWQPFIYVVDLPANVTSPTGFRTRMNKAREALPYLTYITDHYPHFPDVMVFVHAHRAGYPEAWHTDAKQNDAVNMLRGLQLNFVLERGYVNLRCIEAPGCPDEIRPWREPPDPEKVPEQIYPLVYAEFFNRTVAETRQEVELVASTCCAQFAVSKQQILRREKAEYVRYMKYLEETEYSDAHIGRVLEYMWHIMFGQSAVHCEDVKACWCKVYGRCEIRKGKGGRLGLGLGVGWRGG
ncbi:hypothetical protein LTR91_003174 [Friedmanniomyces endolithicus]|uniref:Uncharacterized protein n=1 Tax=Friedmanniomyces endolithicus TaxID=329885 RepID=A0AAN6KXY2_9PEZI|nr:hypothetical protein LTR57_015615 [Friedmanniomyces endolithicus]KAK1008106.1 hypothetical protein LTR91_003174 [Friedmanniomyces endolithicus]KAK1029187.1 hypothetical protein LTS16_019942 [Friedmanniomyces endolithicus]